MTSKMWFLSKKPRAKRILFHTINHTGLGHLNRSIAVAQLLTADNPNLEVLFLIEGGEDFIEPTGLPWILIPSHRQVDENETCEQITQKVLDLFCPDMMIYETVLHEPIHKPVHDAGVREVLMGNMGDLLRGLLRDRLSALNEVDLLLILQQEQEVGSLDKALIAQYSGRTLYAGPLVRQKSRVASENLRQVLGLANEHKVILLTFGGGGTNIAQEMLGSMLAARMQILDRYPQARLIVISGPHFGGKLPEMDEFVCYTSRFEPYLDDYFNIASVIVCMAGYNTVNEVAATGIPTVCVPTPEANDQIGAGSVVEYARSFQGIAIGSANMEELAHHVLAALGMERDAYVTRRFRRKAELASRSIVSEIKSLLAGAV